MTATHSVHIASLGCARNDVDSEELAARLELPLWRVGRVVAASTPDGGAVRLLDEAGNSLPTERKGYDHFA